VLTAIHSGRFLIWSTDKIVPLPQDWAYYVGKGSARTHVLMRVVYSKKDSTAHDSGTGFKVTLTTKPQKTHAAEWKLATSTGAGASALTLRAKEKSIDHFAECHADTMSAIISSPIKVLKFAFAGRKWCKSWKLIETANPGKVLGPTMCPFGPEQGVLPSIGSSGTGDKVLLADSNYSGKFNWTEAPDDIVFKPGHTYRLHCEYDTSTATEDVVGGYDENDAMCQLFIYYEEELGSEPNLGFCMDMAPWQLRQPSVRNTIDLMKQIGSGFMERVTGSGGADPDASSSLGNEDIDIACPSSSSAIEAENGAFSAFFP